MSALTPDGIKQELKDRKSEALQVVREAGSAAELKNVRSSVLGRKSPLGEIRKSLSELPESGRPELGKLINEAMDEVNALLNGKLAQISGEETGKKLEAERMDLTEVPDPDRSGHIHLITRTLNDLEDVFISMGFGIAEGPEVETDWHNFGALNFGDSHPARDMYDTLYVDYGEPQSTLLRTHTSPVQVRTMTSQKPPIFVVAPGRCFRQDTADPTHMPVFHQIEGLVVDEGISMSDLAGTIEAFTNVFFGSGFTSRLRPSYFPFTEPSAEFDIQRPDGTWLELGGCGMVHPNVLKDCGIDPEKHTGFAFGFGIDRLAMIRSGVDDMRDFWTGDIRFLEQF